MKKCFLIRKTINGEYIFDILLGNNKGNEYIYTLAEAHAIDLIAKTISKCEIQVFKKDLKSNQIKETKNDTYWLLNLQPNYHENGTKFIYKLMVKLLTKKQALVLINQNLKRRLFTLCSRRFCYERFYIIWKVFFKYNNFR